MSYYNTTMVKGNLLKAYREKAKTQDEAVYYFLRYVGGPSTPSEVQKSILPDCPLTSVRRSMTNLTKDKLLKKTGEQRIGPYGRPEFVWEYNDV